MAATDLTSRRERTTGRTARRPTPPAGSVGGRRTRRAPLPPGGRRRDQRATGRPAPDRRASTFWWTLGRGLLVVSLLALGIASFVAWRPVTNPGVQDCGSPFGFFVHSRENVVVIPPLPGDDSPPEARRRAAQPPCRQLVADELAYAGKVFVAFLALALAGALMGLLDDRIAHRRAPRFETLLKDLPEDARERHGFVARVRADDLGADLPPVEAPEILGIIAWTAIATAGVVLLASPAQVRDRLGGLQIGPLVLALVGVAAAFAAACFQRRSVSPAGERAARGVAGAVAAAWSARVRPMLGTFGYDVHRLRRSGVGRSEAAPRVQVVQTASLALHLALLVVAALGTLRAPRAAVELRLSVMMLTLVVMLAFIFGLGRSRRRWRALPVRPSPRAVTYERVTPAARGELIGGTLALAGAQTMVMAACLSAFGANGVPLSTVLFVVLAGVTLGAFGPVSGGAGMVEVATMLLLIVAAGADPATAAVVALTYRLVTYWLPLIPGGIVARRLRAQGVI